MLCGFGGSDRLRGNQGDGGRGDDALRGGSGDDALDGGEDFDRLYGEAGTDPCTGEIVRTCDDMR